MSIYSITDVTTAGAFTNALSAAAKSDSEAEARYNERMAKRHESIALRAMKRLTSLVTEQRRKLAVQESEEPINAKLV